MLRDADNVMLNGKYHSNKNISVKNRRKIEVFKKAIWSQLDKNYCRNAVVFYFKNKYLTNRVKYDIISFIETNPMTLISGGQNYD